MVPVVFNELKFSIELFPDCYYSQNKKFKNVVIRGFTVAYFICVIFYTYN